MNEMAWLNKIPEETKDFGADRGTTKKRINELLLKLKHKDIFTYIHSKYTAQYAVLLARELKMTNKMVEDIYIAGFLHDIGKIQTSDGIMKKPGKLSLDEFNEMKQHVYHGLDIVNSIDISSISKNGILYHHERWDGEGYLHGLKGEEIPLEGRILQIADAFSAMINKRVYRERLKIMDAIEEIKRNSGSQFDPSLSDRFIFAIRRRQYINFESGNIL